MTGTHTPFLKWAGGKRWLASNASFAPPKEFKKYVEPFLGGGAVFFHLAPKRAVLSDINSDLITTYKVMRDSPVELQTAMSEHQALHNYAHYYAIREAVPQSDFETASRFLYLNRTCFNGIFRVNQQGKFNVPIGSKETVLFDEDDFVALSDVLKKARILNDDFSKTIGRAREGDFLFVDPPYTVKHNLNGFVRYNEKIFSWNDQVRLAASVKRASDRGVQVMVTNADHKSVRELYQDYGAIYKTVGRSSKIAGPSSARGRVTEAMFTFNM
ncbi:DNA adenine methylase [Maricaulis sp.]|uniref:DNA adenine methylase n=1 Tax=Maricaulis sp. TaxID=1486257 RepID=UPI003A93828F